MYLSAWHMLETQETVLSLFSFKLCSVPQKSASVNSPQDRWLEIRNTSEDKRRSVKCAHCLCPMCAFPSPGLTRSHLLQFFEITPTSVLQDHTQLCLAFLIDLRFHIIKHFTPLMTVLGNLEHFTSGKYTIIE